MHTDRQTHAHSLRLLEDQKCLVLEAHHKSNRSQRACACRRTRGLLSWWTQPAELVHGGRAGRPARCPPAQGLNPGSCRAGSWVFVQHTQHCPRACQEAAFLHTARKWSGGCCKVRPLFSGALSWCNWLWGQPSSRAASQPVAISNAAPDFRKVRFPSGLGALFPVPSCERGDASRCCFSLVF